MNPEEAAAQTLDLAATPTGAFIKDGTVTDVTGNNATVAVDGGGDARPAILGYIPAVGDRVTMLFDPASNGTCVILGTLGGTIPVTLESVYPIGAVYLTYVDEDPADTFGFGTWVQIAEGEAIVGFKTSDTPFGTLGSIGAAGAKTVTLTESQIPAHVHTGATHTHPGPTGTWFHYVASGGSRADGGTGTGYDRDTLGSTGNNTAGDTGSKGGGTSHNNIQPSFVVYIWRRTV